MLAAKITQKHTNRTSFFIINLLRYTNNIYFCKQNSEYKIVARISHWSIISWNEATGFVSAEKRMRFV